MEWAETLPTQCPPENAAPPEDATFYRYVASTPLKEEDLLSQRKIFPNKIFSVDECTARAISVHDTIDGCNNLLKFPRFKKMKLIQITLQPESGVVLKTGTEKNHYSWWRAKNYIPATYSLVE